MGKVYGFPLYEVYIIVIVSCFIWAVMIRFLERKTMMCCTTVLLLFSLFVVLRFTVFQRIGKEQHIFSFFAPHSNEFLREMVMNAFLYFPLGLALGVLIGPWGILAAFVLSLSIEVWQYFAGTGYAQGSDVICNMLGCAVGVLPCIIGKYWKKSANDKRKPISIH